MEKGFVRSVLKKEVDRLKTIEIRSFSDGMEEIICSVYFKNVLNDTQILEMRKTVDSLYLSEYVKDLIIENMVEGLVDSLLRTALDER